MAPRTKVLDETLAGIKKDRPKFFAEFFKKFYGVDTAEEPVSDEVLQWSLNVTMQAGLKSTLACMESIFKTDFRPDLASFKVPTLIIHGTADQNVSIDASATARGARHQELQAHRIRRLAARLAGHRQTTRDRSPVGVPEGLTREVLLHSSIFLPASKLYHQYIREVGMSTTIDTGDETKLPSGIDGLDDIIRGGFPQGCLYLITGTPGTGKTSLAIQFLLEGVAKGERACTSRSRKPDSKSPRLHAVTVGI